MIKFLLTLLFPIFVFAQSLDIGGGFPTGGGSTGVGGPVIGGIPTALLYVDPAGNLGNNAFLTTDITGHLTAASYTSPGLTANTALIANGAKTIASSVTTSAELAFVSGVTSSIQTQLNTLSASTNGTPGQFAGYDPTTGILGPLGAWSWDANDQVVANLLSPQPATNINQFTVFSGVGSPLSGGYEGIIVSPNMSSTLSFLSFFNAEGQFNAGFNNSGATALFQDKSVLAVGASTNGYVSYNSTPQIQGTATGSVEYFAAGATLSNTSNVGNVNGYNDNSQVAAGATIGGYTSFNAAYIFSAALPSGGISGFTASAQINSAITGGVSAYNDFTNMNATSSANNYQSLQLNPNLHPGSSIAFVTGVDVGPNLNGAVTGGFKGIDVSPNGAGVIANITGINVNLAGVSSGAVQKQGLNINDGALAVSSNYDTSVLSPSPGEFQNSSLGGAFHIAPGFPIVAGSFGFGNNLGIGVLAEDNMPADLALGASSIGFSINGFVNQISVVAGKTMDTVNYMAAGGGIPPSSTGGTITNASLFRALGFLPEGGTLNITNLYGFKAESTLCALSPSNCWGVWVGDTTADNWFAKDVVIGGVTGHPTGAFALDVTGNVNISGGITSGATVINSAQSTIPCSTSGSIIATQPFQGPSYSKVVVYWNACVGTATYNFPTPFTNVPIVNTSTGLSTSMVTTLLVGSVLVTGVAPSNTGFMTIEGF